MFIANIIITMYYIFNHQLNRYIYLYFIIVLNLNFFFMNLTIKNNVDYVFQKYI
jgi:diacylglycerol kinase